MTAEEYNHCVTSLSDGIYRFSLKHLRDEYEAENVVQNTFEKLWVRREKVEMETAKSFLFKIAYNNCIDLLRKSNRVGSLDEMHEQNHSHNRQYTDVMEVLRKAVDKLPSAQKSVLMLRDYEGYDYRAIGEIMDMTEAQVKINIFRARQFLKGYIKNIHAVI